MGLHDRIKDQRNKLKETELELEQAQGEEPCSMSNIYTPTKEEYDKHRRTHLPYRTWCPICVHSKRENTGHRQHGKQYRGLPVISLDCMFMGNGAEDENKPIVVMHDSESEGIWAMVAKFKGDDGYIVNRITEIIRGLGYMKVVLKSDQEAGIVDAERRVRDRRHRIAEGVA